MINRAEEKDFVTTLSFEGYDFLDKFDTYITSITSSYINDDGEETLLNFPNFATFALIDNDTNTLKISYKELKKAFKALTGKDMMPCYLSISTTNNIFVDTFLEDNSKIISQAGKVKDSIAVLIYDKNRPSELYDSLLRNGIYVHGRAGVFDEINYEDEDMTNQILPCK